MVLVVFTDARYVAHDRDIQFFEDLKVTYSGTFKDLWCPERPSTYNHKLSCLDDILDWLAEGDAGLCIFVRLILNSNRARWL